jgi:hypothetical protein
MGSRLISQGRRYLRHNKIHKTTQAFREYDKLCEGLYSLT